LLEGLPLPYLRLLVTKPGQYLFQQCQRPAALEKFICAQIQCVAVKRSLRRVADESFSVSSIDFNSAPARWRAKLLE
jgi:hypothetical protein